MLANGTRLGPYLIEAPAGAGGMGEVYKAKDTRLDRTVAIKVLPAHISDNSELRQRFDREAKSISSLNHPHICVLHDIGAADGVNYLVMEYLEGESLADRIKRGPLSREELFRWAIEIGDALSVAHQRGLVHRDLKPGNVMLTREGAKLLDFGLAKRQGAAAPTEALTMTTPLTGTGTLLGTLHYMAPEQLEGTEADERSDIFAFGAMLYEMATGQRAFEGKSQASLIAAILEREPRAASELVSTSPKALDRVLKKCLAKQPEKRWQSVRDLVDELKWIAEGGADAAPLSGAKTSSALVWLGWGLAALLALSTAGLLVRGRTELPRLRAIVTAPPGTQFLLEGDDAGPPIVSPDGKWIAFVAVSPAGAQLWVRELSELAARALPGTDGASFPFWSPDSKSVGFYLGSRLMRMEVSTQQSFSICSGIQGGRGSSWGPDDVIAFSPQFEGDLFLVSAAGGTPTPLTHRDTTVCTTHRWPVFLPDGKHVLYFAGNHHDPQGPGNGIWITSLDGQESHLVMAGLSDAGYADEKLFYVRDSVLFVQPFDPESGKLSGVPRALPDRPQTDLTTWKANFSVSNSGILTYQLAGGKQGTQLTLVDRRGNSIRSIGPRGNHYNLYYAHDGKGVVNSTQEMPFGDLFYLDLERDIRTRLTFGTQDKDSPVLSPAGDMVAFTFEPAGAGDPRYEIRRLAIDGTGGDRLLASDSASDLWPVDWSPDGRHLLALTGDFETSPFGDLLLIPLSGGGAPEKVTATVGQVQSARFSPDGRWIAFSATRGNATQVFVIRSPHTAGSTNPTGSSEDAENSARWQISSAGGSLPRWRGDSKELYYLRTDGTAMAVDVSAEGGAFKVGRETELFRLPLRLVNECWDPSSDGQQFVVNLLAGESSTPIVLVQNWAE